MFSSDEYAATADGLIKRTFHFTTPYPTTRVRLDQLEGAARIVFSLDFLGLDRETRNKIVNPMQGGFLTTSKNLSF